MISFECDYNNGAHPLVLDNLIKHNNAKQCTDYLHCTIAETSPYEALGSLVFQFTHCISSNILLASCLWKISLVHIAALHLLQMCGQW